MVCTPSQVCRCPVCSRQLLAPPAWRAGAVSLAVRESAPQLSVPDLAGRIVEVPAPRSLQIPPSASLEQPKPPPGPKEATSSPAEHPQQGSAPALTPPLLVVVFPQSAQEPAAPQTPLALPQTLPLAGGLELEASSCQVDVALQPPEALADTSRESLRALGSVSSSVDHELFPEEALAPPEEVSRSARLKASWGGGEVAREAALRAASIVTLEAPPQNVTERQEELPSPRSAPSESSEGPPLPEVHSAQEAQAATLTGPPTGVSHRDAESQTRPPDVLGQSSEPDAGLPPGAFSLIRITSMRKRQAQRRAAERAKAPEPKERVYRAAASIDAAMRLTKRPQRPAMTVLRDPR
ncbi:RPS17D [Symbiodinium sp. CCMP2592]|nr:RPS17D [Symbiodinium sp. CCMP2592]